MHKLHTATVFQLKLKFHCIYSAESSSEDKTYLAGKKIPCFLWNPTVNSTWDLRFSHQWLMPYSLAEVYQCLNEIYCLHLQDWRVSWASKQQADYDLLLPVFLCSSTFLWNNCKLLPDCTTSYPKRQHSSWESKQFACWTKSGLNLYGTSVVILTYEYFKIFELIHMAI